MSSNIEKHKSITKKFKKINQEMTQGFPDFVQTRITHWMSNLFSIPDIKFIDILDTMHCYFKADWIDKFELSHHIQFSDSGSGMVTEFDVVEKIYADPDLGIKFLIT